MKVDLNMFQKETIEKALTICNAEDDSILSLVENAFAGNTAYAKLCVAIAAISYNKGFEDGIVALTVKLLESNKEEKGGN